MSVVPLDWTDHAVPFHLMIIPPVPTAQMLLAFIPQMSLKL
ncbi:MAG: hypothetical protein U1A78_30560 [Polyangia bacterium]